MMTLVPAMRAAADLVLPVPLQPVRSGVLPATAHFDARNNRIIAGPGAVLDSYDFRGTMVTCGGDGVVIRNSLFDAAAGFYGIDQSGHTGLAVDRCIFDGGTIPRARNDYSDFIGTRDGEATITDCRFLNAPSDAVQICRGTVSGCYFAGAGYAPGAHADAIWVGKTTGPVLIEGNFIDWRPRPGAVEPNNAIRIAPERGDIDGVTVTGNIILGGGFTVSLGPTPEQAAAGHYKVANVTCTGNIIGLGKYGDFYPSAGNPTEAANISLSRLVKPGP